MEGALLPLSGRISWENVMWALLIFRNFEMFLFSLPHQRQKMEGALLPLSGRLSWENVMWALLIFRNFEMFHFSPPHQRQKVEGALLPLSGRLSCANETSASPCLLSSDFCLLKLPKSYWRKFRTSNPLQNFLRKLCQMASFSPDNSATKWLW